MMGIGLHGVVVGRGGLLGVVLIRPHARALGLWGGLKGVGGVARCVARGRGMGLGGGAHMGCVVATVMVVVRDL